MSKTVDILSSLRDWYGTQKGFSEALNRSLSRVHHHAKTASIGIISANRATNTNEENAQARHTLQKDIKSAGFGFAHVKGVGQEEGGPSSEPSILVIGDKGDKSKKLRNFLVKTGAKHGQMGVLYKHHEEDHAKFIHTSKEHHGEEEDLGKFHANSSAAQYFTRIKGGRQFSFSKETVDVVYLEPPGFMVRRPMFHE